MMGELVPSWYPSSTLAIAFVCYGLIMSSSVTTNGQKTESDERHPMTRQSPFSVPAPVKRLFDVFPLITLPQNELPLRSQQARKAKGHALFCWSTAEDAAGGAASFNPTCLKWQAYLISRNVDFYIMPSNNHASVVERLPFLTLNASNPTPFKRRAVMSSSELSDWAADEKDSWPRELDNLYDAYTGLLDNEIRRAWLYHMYLTPNFETITVPSYIGAQSSSPFIRFISQWELRREAKRELLKVGPKIDVEGLYASAKLSFNALDNIIGRRRRLVATGKPSLLEATLFSYLFLLLELPSDKWSDHRLVDLVRANPTLVAWEAEMKLEFGNLNPPRIYTM